METTDKIFNVTITVPESVDGAVLSFFELAQKSSSIINGVVTYPRKRRSIEDCYEFCKQYFDVTLDDVARSILVLCADNKFNGFYCYEVKRFVFRPDSSRLDPEFKGVSRMNFGWSRSSDHQNHQNRYLAWFSNVMNECYIIGDEK